jgi:hypothetical protein
MTVFHLQLTSNEQTFKYTFSEECEIGLIKMDGELGINRNNLNSSINAVDINNNPIKHIDSYFENPKKIDHIFLKCNLIEDSYINENKVNSIYRFRFDEIIEEPRQIIYHKITRSPKEIILKLVDMNNNLI